MMTPIDENKMIQYIIDSCALRIYMIGHRGYRWPPFYCEDDEELNFLIKVGWNVKRIDSKPYDYKMCDIGKTRDFEEILEVIGDKAKEYAISVLESYTNAIIDNRGGYKINNKEKETADRHVDEKQIFLTQEELDFLLN